MYDPALPFKTWTKYDNQYEKYEEKTQEKTWHIFGLGARFQFKKLHIQQTDTYLHRATYDRYFYLLKMISCCSYTRSHMVKEGS